MSEQQAKPSRAAAEPDATVRRVELAISNVLRGGVIVSLVLIVLGTCVTFARHPSYFSQPAELKQLITPGSHFPHDLQSLAKNLFESRGRGIVTLGLLVLIATPIMRVAISILAFIYQRDRIYTIITATVFCLLLLSLVLGAAE
jgi:uncharacterized membrane protein